MIVVAKLADGAPPINDDVNINIIMLIKQEELNMENLSQQ